MTDPHPALRAGRRTQRIAVTVLTVLTVLTVVGLMLAAVGCAGPTPSAAAHDRPLPVVAAENVWGDLVRQIGGPHVVVTSVISDPSTDPHEYEADPRDAAAVAAARLVVENGVGYDEFMGRLLSAAGGHRTVLDLQQVVGVAGSDPNPHLWYSPTYVPLAAAGIAQALETLDPGHAVAYRTGLATFLRAYEPYVRTVARIRTAYAGTAISYTERVPGYLVTAAGLRLGTPAGFSQAVEDGADPTPADTARFDAAVTGHRIAVLLYNSQVTDAQTTHIKQLASDAGVPVVGVSETIPPAYASFQAWQLAQARALLAALGG